MILDNAQKNQLLRQRGFTEEEISGNLSAYLSGDAWKINTISAKEVRDSFESKVLERLFAKDSINYTFANPFSEYGFHYFAERPVSFNVPAAELDPYIAAFVRAVNLCGAFTCMSCDGWHADQDKNAYRNMILYFPERYSVLWLSIITEYLLGEDWTGKPKRDNFAHWTEQWEPVQEDAETVKVQYITGRVEPKSMMVYRIPKGGEKNAYAKTYGYAEYLLKHQNEIRNIRSKVIEGLKDYKDIELKGFLEVRRKMLAICKEDLKILTYNYGFQ